MFVEMHPSNEPGVVRFNVATIAYFRSYASGKSTVLYFGGGGMFHVAEPPDVVGELLVAAAQGPVGSVLTSDWEQAAPAVAGQPS
ncbi:MAG: hypothetical protein JO290_08575 [Sphingomonadaceae bacterium]|nr:hypothetical protein [Sphingomonadaceae bacterium]